MMDSLDLTRVNYQERDEHPDLPGRPAYLECTDATGKKWRVGIRVIDELCMPDDVWGVPGELEREILRTNRDYLTAAERKALPHVRLSTRAPPPRQLRRWPGARVMTEAEAAEQALPVDPVDIKHTIAALAKFVRPEQDPLVHLRYVL